MNTLFKTLLLGFIFSTSNTLFGQCADTTNIYSFVYNGKIYELVKENKSWADASSCAVERGGILAEINDSLEQAAVFSELNLNAGIVLSSTIAADGGNGSYVWIGGNDLAVEGEWIWDGDNDNNGAQFWQGTASGNSVGGLFSNWGNEPDDFGSGQDGLGFALTNWPLGVAGQWNDVDDSNNLYYLIELPSFLNLEDKDDQNSIKIHPNPFDEFISIEDLAEDVDELIITNSLGEKVRLISVKESSMENIDLSALPQGTYFLQFRSEKETFSIHKVIKTK
jgi:Secretion system C-terminal sorting domain/Lectin C-type domain